MTPRTRRFVALILIVAFAGLAVLAWVLSRPGGPAGNPAVGLAPVQTGLAWPIALAFAPDGRAFFAERYTGNIRILETGTIRPNPFFTIPEIALSGEQGLLGLALDPDFESDPYVYAYYTRNDGANASVYNRIVRIRASGSLGTTFEIVLDRIPAASFHDGGVIAFGPDGKLYAVVGDAQVASSAQDLSRPTGKVLRMNPDGSAPADNPYARNVTVHPLVYTYGHRNMFGIAWHPTTLEAYITENGPGDNDEINRLIPGANYGWPQVLGIATRPPFVDPLIAYTPVIVPTNAAFYTASIPAVSRNHLVFGSFEDGRLRELSLALSDGVTVLNETILASAGEGIVDVEMGPDGYLWVTTPSGIFRLVPSPPAAYASVVGTVFPTGLVLATAVRASPTPGSPGARPSYREMHSSSRKP